MSEVNRPVRVVLDQQDGPAFEPQRRGAVLRSLLEGGYSVTVTGEQRSVSPLDDAELVVLRELDAGSDHDAEATQGGLPVHFRGVAGLDEAAVLEVVEAQGAGRQAADWKPWFPVIDYDRCTNCMQCLSFCLFGVYDVDDEKQIDVANPDKCKTNCPACSRVCPEVAILFPKYKNGPINGDIVQAEDVDREKMKTDISSLLGGDIYSLLRQRHERASSRFSKERDESRALKERKRCLAKLQQNLDIPAEVLDELPSAEAILEKAAAASKSR
ncbi:MAG: ferredoxin family protein [Acidobacteriota bacterium]